MKTKIFFGLGAVVTVLAVTGCVETVTNKEALGVPWVRDYFEGQYERSVDQVFDAAKTVLNRAGTLVSESTLHGQTNTVKTLEAKVNQRNVYVRVQSVTPTVTALAVQARHPAGASDTPLAHQLEKEMALALVGTR
jgi:hypothetical protein